MRLLSQLTKILAALVLLTFARGAFAQAPLTIYNTGMSTPWNSGAPSPFTDGTVDTHWTIFSMPNGSAANAITATNNAAWLANNSTSKWLNDTGNGGDGTSPNGNYTYRTTFNLPGNTNLAGVSLVFNLSVDNSLTQINLNGTNTGLSSAASFNAWSSPLTINSGFQTGTNTLDFLINNAGTGPNPQGLRVEFTSASIVPEPASLALVALGLLTLSQAVRSRQPVS